MTSLSKETSLIKKEVLPLPPTRIPQAEVVPFQCSASMRLRENRKEEQQLIGSAGSENGFSTRAKLTKPSSSTTSGSSNSAGSLSHLTRNRSWSNLGHKTATSSPTKPEVKDAPKALCPTPLTPNQKELSKSTDNQMDGNAATINTSKSRNMSLKLNGGETTTNEAAVAATTTATSTPPHNCIRQGHCIKATPPKKLSTLHEAKISPKTPPVTPDSPSTYLDDDLDSMYSFVTTTSGRSTMSCEHPYVARNGTTFSGRKMKYVVHCSNYAGQVGPDYLTPTQRAQRQIRRLKELLCVARQDLEQKDSELLRLTREVVELRVFKASLSSPEERSASSDAVTVREAELKTSQDVSPIVEMVDEANAKCSPLHLARQQQQQLQMSAEMQSSYADSGHFEDLTMSSVHSKDSQTQSEACGASTPDGEADVDAEAEAGGADVSNLENYELQRQELIRMYERRIEELIRTQDGATSELKRSHNDKVEALLQKLAECNTRYSDIVPDYEQAKQRIRELEKQLEDLQRKLIEHEDKQKKMYLHMYQQGQESERIARADQALELAQRQPDSKVSINELLQQLQSTQDELENIRTIYRRLLDAQKNRTHVDPEVTLQFLKSAIFYFLTDKENSQGHLQAIESILEFTDEEKQKINQARSPK
ncbi:protein quick-to-court isoform X2 [Drosophila willistoni]|uniref:protein quick-to-court isoform X2 n=1 Tax=Drosophila willistoni TaxID=7260 RepID=UPI001F075E5E|nr:protein quick-to-court isoform X2 [Drosophila willistoni]